MYLPSPGPGISGRFLSIINGLCRALGTYTSENRAGIPLAEVIFRALRRRAKRFADLVTRVEAGLVPVARPCAAPSERVPTDDAVSERVPRSRSSDGMPRRRGWLLRMLKHEGAHCYWQLRALLEEPEMAALIAADPQFGRLLRPLWRMIGANAMPDVLYAPPRPPGPPRRKFVRAVRPPPSPVAPEPPAVRRERMPYIIGFGPPPFPT